MALDSPWLKSKFYFSSISWEQIDGFWPNFAYALILARSRFELLHVRFHKFETEFWSLTEVRIRFPLNIWEPIDGFWPNFAYALILARSRFGGERGGSVVECRTPEREVRGSRPTSAVLCPWARHFTPRKYWLITQEAMAPSRHDWKIVDWDVKPQHNQPTKV